MPSSERRTVSTCRHDHHRSAPAAPSVRRMRRAGSLSRGLRTPCLSRPCAGPTSPQQSNALLQRPHRHDVWRLRRGASVRTRAAGRLGSQARRHSGSVMIRRRSTCRTATSMHVAPTRLVAGATRRMKCCSLNFSEHQGEFDVRGAAEATAAARVRRSKHRRTGCAGFALAPAAARRRSRWVFRKIMEIHMPKFGPDRHNGSPPHRDALRQGPARHRRDSLGAEPDAGPGLNRQALQQSVPSRLQRRTGRSSARVVARHRRDLCPTLRNSPSPCSTAPASERACRLPQESTLLTRRTCTRLTPSHRRANPGRRASGSNYVLDGDRALARGWVARARDNIAAIRLSKEIEAAGRAPTR